MRNKSLLCAYVLDGKGAGKKLNWEAVERWEPSQGQLWLHMNLLNKKSINWLNKHSQLDKSTIRSLTAQETRPHVLFTQHGMIVSLRAVNSNPNQEPEDMVSIRIWIDKDRMISMQRRSIASIRDMQDSIEDGVGPVDLVNLLQDMLDKITDRLMDVLEQIDEKIDGFEQPDSQISGVISELAEIQREIINLYRYLAPQRDAIMRLCSHQNNMIDEHARYQLQLACDRVTRYLEELQLARERAAILQADVMSRQNEQLNRRMYILSMVAVIFLPLSFITGLLGINVGGIPGATHPDAFLVVCLSLFIVGIITLVWFKRRQWF